MTAPASSEDERYQRLQDIYLKWHSRRRPLSGFICELKAELEQAEAAARTEELEMLVALPILEHETRNIETDKKGYNRDKKRYQRNKVRSDITDYTEQRLAQLQKPLEFPQFKEADPRIVRITDEHLDELF